MGKGDPSLSRGLRRGLSPSSTPGLRKTHLSEVLSPAHPLLANRLSTPTGVAHSISSTLRPTPDGVVGKWRPVAIPGSSSGLSPLLDTRATKEAPLRGASLAHPLLANRLSTPTGVAHSKSSTLRPTPDGVVGKGTRRFPGVFVGAFAPPRHPGYERCTSPRCFPCPFSYPTIDQGEILWHSLV